MANAHTEQTIIDGDRNIVVKCTGILDTSDLAALVIIDPTTFSPQPTQVRIDHIDYSISDQIEVILYWEATADVVIMPLAGRGRLSFWNFGGLQNNAGAGKTGAIKLATNGWYSGIQYYSLVFELVKQGV